MALINDLGDSKVTIKKEELLSVLKINREQHSKDYQESYLGFKVAVEEKMVENLELLRSTGKIQLTVSLTVPQEHTKEYDRVIRMLEMSTADEITVSESQFIQYVMDEWNWKAGFIGTTSLYNNKIK